MKLRDLLDRAGSGMLDTDVNIKLVTYFQGPNRYTSAIKSEDHPLASVEIEDDGSVSLVVHMEG